MDMFDDEWMNKYKDAWNGAEEVSDALAKIDFTSTIGCGFIGEDKPRGVLVVEKGKATHAGNFNGEDLNWDLRASEDNWKKWQENGISMAGLGMAYTTGKLKFLVGDYGSMIKNPSMAGPFVKSFGLMGHVK